MNLFDVYSIFPINIVRGSGCYVYDDNGNSYLDFYGGHAVISIGHSHPYLVKCMYEQMQNLMFYSNSVVNKLQEKLAYELGEISGYSDYSAFFVNSGAEANENALKLASFHTGKKKVIAFRNSFHGRTSAAVEVTDNPLITAPLNCNDNVYFSGMDIAEVESVLRSGDVCAVIIEGISGVGGIRVPEDDFLKELRKVTIQYGAILIMDEIQSGYGRTGKFFAHQWSGIKPDIITVAKGIANGFPFSGVLISDVFKPRKGMLGTTFGGNHLGMRPIYATVHLMRDGVLYDTVRIGNGWEWNWIWQNLDPNHTWTVEADDVEGYDKLITHEGNQWRVTYGFTYVPPAPPDPAPGNHPTKEDLDLMYSVLYDDISAENAQDVIHVLNYGTHIEGDG